jgi:hypothetical protein
VYGGLNATNGAVLQIIPANSSYKVSIYKSSISSVSGINISYSSIIKAVCDIEISGSGFTYGLRIDYTSTFITNKNLSLSISDVVNHAISIDGGTFVSTGDSISIDGANIPTGITMSNGQMFLRCSLDMSSAGCSYCISMEAGALFSMNSKQDGTRPFLKMSSTGTTVSIYSGSFVLYYVDATITSGATTLWARSCGDIRIFNSTIDITTSSSTPCIFCENSSCCLFDDTAFTLDGAALYGTVHCRNASCVTMTSSVTMAGNITGSRYSVGGASVIDTNGKGANFIPGDSAGSATSTSYGVYK